MWALTGSALVVAATIPSRPARLDASLRVNELSFVTGPTRTRLLRPLTVARVDIAGVVSLRTGASHAQAFDIPAAYAFTSVRLDSLRIPPAATVRLIWRRVGAHDTLSVAISKGAAATVTAQDGATMSQVEPAQQMRLDPATAVSLTTGPGAAYVITYDASSADTPDDGAISLTDQFTIGHFDSDGRPVSGFIGNDMNSISLEGRSKPITIREGDNLEFRQPLDLVMRSIRARDGITFSVTGRVNELKLSVGSSTATTLNPSWFERWQASRWPVVIALIPSLATTLVAMIGFYRRTKRRGADAALT